MTEFEEIDCYGLRPASFCMLIGASGQGKSSTVLQIIEQSTSIIPDLCLKKLIIVYSEQQELFEKMRTAVGNEVKVEMHEGIIPVDYLHRRDTYPDCGDTILLLDDVANDAWTSKPAANLLIKLSTTYCHHR
jgi:hypothetical protein